MKELRLEPAVGGVRGRRAVVKIRYFGENTRTLAREHFPRGRGVDAGKGGAREAAQREDSVRRAEARAHHRKPDAGDVAERRGARHVRRGGEPVDDAADHAAADDVPSPVQGGVDGSPSEEERESAEGEDLKQTARPQRAKETRPGG